MINTLWSFYQTDCCVLSLLLFITRAPKEGVKAKHKAATATSKTTRNHERQFSRSQSQEHKKGKVLEWKESMAESAAPQEVPKLKVQFDENTKSPKPSPAPTPAATPAGTPAPAKKPLKKNGLKGFGGNKPALLQKFKAFT